MLGGAHSSHESPEPRTDQAICIAAIILLSRTKCQSLVGQFCTSTVQIEPKGAGFAPFLPFL
jgi:hypothetical protein